MIESFIRSLFNRPEAYCFQRNPELDKEIERSNQRASEERQALGQAWVEAGGSNGLFVDLCEQGRP